MTADDMIKISQNQLFTCHNFTWRSDALAHTILINDNHLQLNGSITLEQKLETNYGSITFTSSKEEIHHFHQTYFDRSEERRVGKECIYQCSREYYSKTRKRNR